MITMKISMEAVVLKGSILIKKFTKDVEKEYKVKIISVTTEHGTWDDLTMVNMEIKKDDRIHFEVEPKDAQRMLEAC